MERFDGGELFGQSVTHSSFAFSGLAPCLPLVYSLYHRLSESGALSANGIEDFHFLCQVRCT